MNNLVEQVGRTLARRKLLPRGRPLLVAVSGGVDSMVLLHVLRELAQTEHWPLTVAHLNHHLRGRSSDADERLVRKTSARLGIRCVVGHADIRRLAREEKLSVEMAARQARHTFLAQTAKRLKIPVVALAHHADDQVELFFLRLFRGAGGEGLAGMRWRAPSPVNRRIALVRPLLATTKAELEELAAAANIRFREDATNACLDIQRNRIRHELLPLLKRHYQPALGKTVPRLMEILGAEADVVGAAARRWLASPTSFNDLPAAVQRRVVQSQLLEEGIQPDFELVEELRQFEGRKVQVALPGLGTSRAARDSASEPPWSAARGRSGLLEFTRCPEALFAPAQAGIDLDRKTGQAVLGGTRVQWRIQRRRGVCRPQPVPGREFFDADRVGPEIVLRHWQPGDRFQPIGAPSASKLQDIFVNQKVARAARHRRLLATTAAGEIFWVEGLRISERFKLTNKTNRRLRWSWRAA